MLLVAVTNSSSRLTMERYFRFRNSSVIPGLLREAPGHAIVAEDRRELTGRPAHRAVPVERSAVRPLEQRSAWKRVHENVQIALFRIPPAQYRTEHPWVARTVVLDEPPNFLTMKL